MILVLFVHKMTKSIEIIFFRERNKKKKKQQQLAIVLNCEALSVSNGFVSEISYQSLTQIEKPNLILRT